MKMNGKFEDSEHTVLYSNSKLHREDGPAIVWKDGTQHWYQHGMRHRVGGPAIDGNNGTRKWFVEGLLHREDGPAITWFNGKLEWWIHGIELTERDFNAWIDGKSKN